MTEAERDRAEFEEKFPPPDDVVYNPNMGLYCWATHAASMHAFNEVWESWKAAKASEAGGAQQAEAEPVATVMQYIYDDDAVIEMLASLTVGQKLYAAPPAPAPVVPEMKQAVKHSDPRDQWYAMGWNDCRAEIASSSPQPAEQERTCRWETYTDTTSTTQCGKVHSHKIPMAYCPSCGGKIVEGE